MKMQVQGTNKEQKPHIPVDATPAARLDDPFGDLFGEDGALLVMLGAGC